MSLNNLKTVIDINAYNTITFAVQKCQGLTKDCQLEMQLKYPDIHPATLSSVISQEYQKIVKQKNYKNTIDNTALYNEYEKISNENYTPYILVQLAIEHGLPPTILAKIILKQYYDGQASEDEECANKSSKRNINSMLRDTTLIENKRLAYEIFLCTLLDDQYSPLTETIKHTVGQQYEIRLCRHLTNLGIAFKDEDSLRKTGYDKTPDVKLEVPVAYNGLVINWIESKALFADEDVHKGYMKDQYLSYWNRFGPGMVIYWFGYLETIIDSSEKRIVVVADVPDNFISFRNMLTTDIS